MWVAGVQEMHEGRETKLLPIQLGRRPSSSKPGTFKHVIPNSRKLQSLGAGGWYPNYLLVSSNCHPLVSQLSLRCSHLSPTVARLPCRCGLAIVSCLPILSRDVSRLSSACSSQRPLVSQMWFSLVSQLPPRCDLPVISHLCPLALNLEPSLLLVKDAEGTPAECTPWLKKNVWYS